VALYPLSYWPSARLLSSLDPGFASASPETRNLFSQRKFSAANNSACTRCSTSAAPARIPDRLRFAPDNFKPGGKIGQSCGGSSPRLVREVSLHCAIPASCSGGNERFACVCFSYCPRGEARIELASPPQSRRRFTRSNAHLHHAGIFCGGNQRQKILSRCSVQ